MCFARGTTRFAGLCPRALNAPVFTRRHVGGKQLLIKTAIWEVKGGVIPQLEHARFPGAPCRMSRRNYQNSGGVFEERAGLKRREEEGVGKDCVYAYVLEKSRHILGRKR